MSASDENVPLGKLNRPEKQENIPKSLNPKRHTTGYQQPSKKENQHKNTEKKVDNVTWNLDAIDSNKKKLDQEKRQSLKKPEAFDTLRSYESKSADTRRSSEDLLISYEPRKTDKKEQKRSSKNVLPPKNSKRISQNPLIPTRSESIAKEATGTVINRDDIEKGTKLIAKQTNPEAESHFISSVALATMRFFFASISLLYVIWMLTDHGKLFFNQLIGWNWISIGLYFVIAFFKSYQYLAQKTFFEFYSPIFDILFVSTTSISLFLPILYWSFIRSVNVMKIDTWSPIEYQVFAGYHVGLLLMLFEVIFSCQKIVKIHAFIPPLAIMFYIFQVWLTHYVYFWDWPMNLFDTYLQKDFHFMFLVACFTVAVITVVFCSIIVYMLIQFRDLMNERKTQYV